MGHIMWRCSTERRTGSQWGTGGPRLMCVHREQWPSSAVTCLWLMSTGQWFCEKRLHPCSRALSFGAVGLETIPRDETRFSLGVTWILLFHALCLLLLSLPSCLHRHVFSHMALGMMLGRLPPDGWPDHFGPDRRISATVGFHWFTWNFVRTFTVPRGT